MKVAIVIFVSIFILVVVGDVRRKSFEEKYNIYKPQRYKIIFCGVGLDTLILYAPTREVAEKISIDYLFGFDECYIEELSEEQIEQEYKSKNYIYNHY